MSDVDDVTDAADKVEAKLPHDVVEAMWHEQGPTLPIRKGFTFADIITDLDKQALLEFGRNIT